jgi:hypothetical protein
MLPQSAMLHHWRLRFLKNTGMAAHGWLVLTLLCVARFMTA